MSRLRPGRCGQFPCGLLQGLRGGLRQGLRGGLRGAVSGLEIMNTLYYYLYVRIFRNTWFTRFARKENITDGELRELVKQLEAGQADANLGGGVYKIRLARSGEGKSGAYRIIVFFKIKSRAFFVYGYAKSDRDSIDKKETALQTKWWKEKGLIYPSERRLHS